MIEKGTDAHGNEQRTMSESIPIDFSDHASTVTVERDPTANEIAQTQAIAKLTTRLCDLKRRNSHLDEVRQSY